MPDPDGGAEARPDATSLLRLHSPEVKALVEKLRTLVRSSLGTPEERVYAGWNGLGYHDEQAGYVCGIFPRRQSVRLHFEHGASLADPDRVFSGGGSQTRYLELAPRDEVPEDAIRAMIERAVLLGALRP